MNHVADSLPDPHYTAEVLGVSRPLPEKHYGWGFQKGTQVLKRYIEIRGRIEDTGVRYHPQELVDARPRQGPGILTFSKTGQQRGCLSVMRGLLPLRIDEDIGIDRDHERPSIRSKRASRSSSRTPG